MYFQAALTAIKQLAEAADGTVTLQLYKGNMFFQSLKDVPQSIYKVRYDSLRPCWAERIAAAATLPPSNRHGALTCPCLEAIAVDEAPVGRRPSPSAVPVGRPRRPPPSAAPVGHAC